MKKFVVLLCVGLLVFGVTGIASALNVTIYDRQGSGGEDNETEPNTLTGQHWDLEAFFLDGTLLTLVGGFDFENGVTDKYGRDWAPGDIFVDIDGDAVFPVPDISV